MNNTISSTNNYLEHYKSRLQARCPKYGTANVSFSGYGYEQQNEGGRGRSLLYAVGGVLVGAGVTGLLALAGRGKHIDTSRFTSKISDLEGQVETLTRQASSLREENKGMSARLTDAADNLSRMAAELQEKKANIKRLEDKINFALQNVPETKTSYVDTLIQDYRKSLLSRKLDYNPMEPLKNGKPLQNSTFYDYDTSFVKVDPPAPPIIPEGCFDASKLSEEIEKIREGETFQIPFEKSENIKVKKAEDAEIEGIFIKKIGVTENSDTTIQYGIKIKWPYEKMARDMLQNFYDGHGHTLDGVKMVITRSKGGKYKVRIEGQSTYNCKYIKAIGASTKSENLHDAGGFGEGLKVVNVQMLARNISDKISYGSANWRYDITPGEEYMQRTLHKVKDFDGNFVEFETTDKNFLKKLIEATNYFEHSKNPDFRSKNLIYQNEDMGIAFLGKEQKGNLYIGQRFAYGEEDGWQSLDGLTLFFRRKPNTDFSIDRDRGYFNNDGLKKIIEEFVKCIPEKDALDIIIKMQSVWKLEENTKPPAYKILLEALCNRIRDCNKRINLIDQKYATVDYFEQRDGMIERLKEYGYTPCDPFFGKIGMHSATNVLNQFSAHTPLEPTAAEIKKIHILGEAVKIVQEIYDRKLTPEILNNITDGQPIIGTNGFERWRSIIEAGNLEKIKNIVDDVEEKVDKKIEELIRQRINSSQKIDTNEMANQRVQIYKELLIQTLNEKILKIDECDQQTQEELFTLLGELSMRECIDDRICKKLQKYMPSLALIKKSNPNSPVFIFDRTAEKAEDTLAEAMIKDGEYLGHWVSRDHLKDASFSDNLATWLHEMCHQYAGDGQPRFGYKLTDLLGDTFKLTLDQRCSLSALEKLYDEVSKTQ